MLVLFVDKKTLLMDFFNQIIWQTHNMSLKQVLIHKLKLSYWIVFLSHNECNRSEVKFMYIFITMCDIGLLNI